MTPSEYIIDRIERLEEEDKNNPELFYLKKFYKEAYEDIPIDKETQQPLGHVYIEEISLGQYKMSSSVFDKEELVLLFRTCEQTIIEELTGIPLEDTSYQKQRDDFSKIQMELMAKGLASKQVEQTTGVEIEIIRNILEGRKISTITGETHKVYISYQEIETEYSEELEYVIKDIYTNETIAMLKDYYKTWEFLEEEETYDC